MATTMVFEGRKVPLRSEKQEVLLYFSGAGSWAVDGRREPYRFICIGNRTQKGKWSAQCIEVDKPLPPMNKRERAPFLRLLRETLAAATGHDINMLRKDLFLEPQVL